MAFLSDMSSSRNFFFHLWLLISQFVVTVYAATDGKPWNYQTEGGVFAWCHFYDKCCGDQQSPVNFDTNSLLPEAFASIKFNGYETKPKWIELYNNGHAIYIDLEYPGPNPYMTDGGLGDNYTVASFHFHWGSDDEQGAEHTVNGIYFPLELHIVHFNSKYGSIEKALANKDGLAVLGIFYEVTEEDNPALDTIVKALKDVTYSGDKMKITKPNLSLMDLFPISTEYFYRYMGSLTTPPCDEIVTWTVFEVPQTMSINQMKAFRKLMSSKKTDKPNNVTLSDNYRPVQKLKGRKIYKRQVSGSNAVSAQFPLLFTAAASALSSRLI